MCTKDKQKAQRKTCTDVCLVILKTYICHNLTATWHTCEPLRTPCAYGWQHFLKKKKKHSWKCNCHISSVTFHNPVSMPMSHNSPPSPNNNIVIILNHTVPSQPTTRESLELRNESKFIFISLWADGQKTAFLAYICLPLKKKKEKAAIH